MAQTSESETQRVLVTGGQGGLAMACREAFEGLGWEVLAPTRSEMDVADSDSVDRYISGSGAIDLLVCAAGSIDDALLLKLSEDAWDGVLDAHLSGAFRCARAVSRGMLRQRSGHVVFIGSYSGFHPPVGQAHYAAAKAGLSGMMRSLAQEWGGRGVRSNLVVPGFLETKMTSGLPASVQQASLSKHALGAFNTPEKVAQFIAFLHAQMTATSGQTFNLDSRIL
ncbi:SDR family oxidoreductase [Rubritalea marina]|uniref:SDR family oxidoreductase n=1 Tax=Rubritalea marina TaxID=361055 RepID=UPI0003753092|nr:SDR family oxidoreductase [Rubritalea marina]